MALPAAMKMAYAIRPGTKSPAFNSDNQPLRVYS